MNPFIEAKKSNGIIDVPGFQSVATSCDVRNKKDGRLDLALILSPTPCSAAGVFTKNAFKAAPVKLCQELLRVENKFHGIGGPLSVMRTVQQLERIGATAIQIEDQIMPKRRAF